MLPSEPSDARYSSGACSRSKVATCPCPVSANKLRSNNQTQSNKRWQTARSKPKQVVCLPPITAKGPHPTKPRLPNHQQTLHTAVAPAQVAWQTTPTPCSPSTNPSFCLQCWCPRQRLNHNRQKLEVPRGLQAMCIQDTLEPQALLVLQLLGKAGQSSHRAFVLVT